MLGPIGLQRGYDCGMKTTYCDLIESKYVDNAGRLLGRCSRELCGREAPMKYKNVRIICRVQEPGYQRPVTSGPVRDVMECTGCGKSSGSKVKSRPIPADYPGNDNPVASADDTE